MIWPRVSTFDKTPAGTYQGWGASLAESLIEPVFQRDLADDRAIKAWLNKLIFKVELSV
jgi:hypothetical protein